MLKIMKHSSAKCQLLAVSGRIQTWVVVLSHSKNRPFTTFVYLKVYYSLTNNLNIW